MPSLVWMGFLPKLMGCCFCDRKPFFFSEFLIKIRALKKKDYIIIHEFFLHSVIFFFMNLFIASSENSMLKKSSPLLIFSSKKKIFLYSDETLTQKYRSSEEFPNSPIKLQNLVGTRSSGDCLAYGLKYFCDIRLSRP